MTLRIHECPGGTRSHQGGFSAGIRPQGWLEAMGQERVPHRAEVDQNRGKVLTLFITFLIKDLLHHPELLRRQGLEIEDDDPVGARGREGRLQGSAQLPGG